MLFSAVRSRLAQVLPTRSARLAAVFALVLGLAWSAREVALARETAAAVKSATITLDQVRMREFRVDGKDVGQIGEYLTGDTPASTKFVTGRFVLNPGQTPHPPHTHVEEEVMVIEKGTGEIVCDGKTTKIGPGSVMYTTPNAPHGIVNTGSEPIVFFYIKWAARDAR
jgi:mannose-6-phosphate isomerase-like protein (cupin superfamily)